MGIAHKTASPWRTASRARPANLYRRETCVWDPDDQGNSHRGQFPRAIAAAGPSKTALPTPERRPFVRQAPTASGARTRQAAGTHVLVPRSAPHSVTVCRPENGRATPVAPSEAPRPLCRDTQKRSVPCQGQQKVAKPPRAPASRRRLPLPVARLGRARPFLRDSPDGRRAPRGPAILTLSSAALRPMLAWSKGWARFARSAIRTGEASATESEGAPNDVGVRMHHVIDLWRCGDGQQPRRRCGSRGHARRRLWQDPRLVAAPPQVDFADIPAAAAREDLDRRKSIVDLMELLKLNSSLPARKQLATELHGCGSLKDSRGDERLVAQAGHAQARRWRRQGARQAPSLKASRGAG